MEDVVWVSVSGAGRMMGGRTGEVIIGFKTPALPVVEVVTVVLVNCGVLGKLRVYEIIWIFGLPMGVL